MTEWEAFCERKVERSIEKVENTSSCTGLDSKKLTVNFQEPKSLDTHLAFKKGQDGRKQHSHKQIVHHSGNLCH